MEIARNVHSIKLFSNRAFLITGKELTLIDAGFPLQSGKIITFIRSIGRKPEELSLIILTHHHIDHRGSARAVKKLTGAKVAAHVNDIPFVEGQKHAHNGHRLWWVRLLFFILELIFKHEKVRVDIKLKDREYIGGLTVIHSPGHTEGSISLFLMNNKILFCGDTVPYTLGKLKSLNPYTMNHNQERESIQKLSEMDCDILLPNDCKMVLKDGKSMLREFCKNTINT